MKTLRPFALILLPLLLAALACQAVTGAPAPIASVLPPTAIPTIEAVALLDPPPQPPPPQAAPTQALATNPPPTASSTAIPTAAPTETALPASPTPDLAPAIQVTPSALQIQVFNEIWKTVQENYLYPDFNGLDWDAVYQEYSQRVEAGMTGEAFYQTMEEMIESLGDEHSTYLDPERAAREDSEAAGEFQYPGIGVLTLPLPEKQKASVLLVFPGSPAEAAGLQAHDNILAADGQSIFDENGARLNLLRGPEGSSVNVTVQSPGQEPRTIPITRRSINASIPVPHTVLTTPNGKRIGYIFLISFFDRTIGPQFEQALRNMTASGPLDGLIIDDRFNGGGSTDVALEVLGTLVDGTLGHFIWRDSRSPLTAEGRDINGSQSLPLAVLVGKDSVSYGEVFPGILRDQGRAVIIGETTDGNVEVLSIFTFTDGSRAWIATQTFRPLNNPDVNWEESGIIPDLVASSAWDEVTIETDPAIITALQYFDYPALTLTPTP